MKKTEWRGQECPPLYTERLNGGQRQLTVFVDIQENAPEGQEDAEAEAQGRWTATAITLPVGIFDYDTIVASIICARYTSDRMQAIQNNYIGETDISGLADILSDVKHFPEMNSSVQAWLSSRDAGIVGEYEEMQNYRRYAKRIAHEILDELSKTED